MRAVKATLLDDDAFRLLAIPFTGPIPSPRTPKGVDLDGEWFDEVTDIKPTWMKARPVDWHHGKDRMMQRTVIGKAVDLEMDDEGWWVTVWLQAGEQRLNLIRQLQERGGQLFGSSETIGELARVKADGHIDVWPFWRQTLSTSPQNTHSVLRPMKAALAEALADEGYNPSDAFWAEITAELGDLSADLHDGAKAGPPDSDGGLEQALARLGAPVDRLMDIVRKH